VILTDELVLGHRQRMTVMNLVHPITALYAGPLWVWAYFRHGRSHDVVRREAERLVAEDCGLDRLRSQGESVEPRHLQSWHASIAASHCGAGCTLGDIGGEWILSAVFGAPVLGAAGTYGWEVVADFVLAWTIGIVFQYFTIVPMRPDLGPARRHLAGVKVDTLSILAFQVGLFGWMAISHFVLLLPPLPIDTGGHWFMMLIGIVLGFFTAWPVNRLLLRRGIKEKMDHRKHLGEMAEHLRDGQATAKAPLTRADRDADRSRKPDRVAS
jgi:hypothetical protein